MFIVETKTLCDGFVNVWTTDGQPTTFHTEAEAKQELNDYLEEQHDAVDAGDMTDKYPCEDFRVVEVES
tara:strand:- start:227 stop:433 length:207 start_codon:yes stop_codon:yes gene_type:complete